MNTRLFKLGYFIYDQINGRVQAVFERIADFVDEAQDCWGADDER